MMYIGSVMTGRPSSWTAAGGGESLMSGMTAGRTGRRRISDDRRPAAHHRGPLPGGEESMAVVGSVISWISDILDQ